MIWWVMQHFVQCLSCMSQLTSLHHRDMRYKTEAIPGCGVNRYVLMFVGTEPSKHSTFPLELCFHQGPSILELHADDKPLMASNTNTEICRERFQVISHNWTMCHRMESQSVIVSWQEHYADVERSLPIAMTIPTTMTRIMEPLKKGIQSDSCNI